MSVALVEFFLSWWMAFCCNWS